MDQVRVKVHKLEKKEWRQYPAILTKQAWSKMDLLYDWAKNTIFLWDTLRFLGIFFLQYRAGGPKQAR